MAFEWYRSDGSFFELKEFTFNNGRSVSLKEDKSGTLFYIEKKSTRLASSIFQKAPIRLVKEGLFYKANKNKYLLLNEISFGTLCIAPIAQIRLRRYGDGSCQIEIFPAELHINEVHDLFKQIYLPNEMLICTLCIRLDFNEINLDKLIRLFKYENEKYNEEIFSKALVAELKNILAALENKAEANKHILSLFPAVKSYINPGRQFSKSLLRLLDVISFKKSVDEIEKRNNFSNFLRLLSYGEDPNQTSNKLGLSAFFYIIAKNMDLYFLQFILLYGGNPFIRDCYGHPSGYEMAIKYRNRNAVEYIAKLSHKVKRPLKHTFIESINVTYNEDVLYTRIQFENGLVLINSMKKVTSLTKQEKEALLQMFLSCFEVPDDTTKNKILKAFNSEFSDNKVIELIKKQNKIIGFNVWEFIVSIININNITSHCSLALIAADECSGAGLMSFLSFRPAYALRLLYPKHNVFSFYVSINFPSFNQAKNELFFPKYQSNKMKKLAKEILETVYGNELILIQNDKTLTFFVYEELCVKANLVKQYVDPLFELFNSYVLNNENEEQKTLNQKAAPVLYPVRRESFKNFESFTAEYLGLKNLSEHIEKFSAYMKKLLPNVKQHNLKHNQSTDASSCHTVFWDEEQISKAKL